MKTSNNHPSTLTVIEKDQSLLILGTIQ